MPSPEPMTDAEYREKLARQFTTVTAGIFLGGVGIVFLAICLRVAGWII